MIDRNKVPHKHAAVIKAWADGASVECRHLYATAWVRALRPNWCDDTEYRIVPEPHKWQKEMDAYDAGKTLQVRCAGGEWSFGFNKANSRARSARDAAGWYTDPQWEYRIKPEEVQKAGWAYIAEGGALFVNGYAAKQNLKLTFEEGELIKAEVIK